MSKPTHPVVCDVCGDVFEAKREDAQMCSDRCRKRAQVERDRKALADLLAALRAMDAMRPAD